MVDNEQAKQVNKEPADTTDLSPIAIAIRHTVRAEQRERVKKLEEVK